MIFKNVIITPNTSKDTYSVYEYDYLVTLEDRIYASQIRNTSIKNECLKETEERHNNHLAGDIEKEYKIKDLNTLTLVEEELKGHLSNILKTHIERVNINTDLWVNYQEAGEFNPLHMHTGMYSFVIYASIPEEIREEYKQSHSGRSQVRGLIQFQSNRVGQQLNFNPRENDIFIFQSDHLHQVYPFYSNNTRISIAGNIHSIELSNGEILKP
jgi:hypothetical protein